MDLKCIPKFVINLDKRTDRLKLFDVEFRSFFGEGQSYTRVSAEYGEPGRRFVAKSHKKVIRMAQDMGAEYACIMEDDVILSPGGFDYMQNCLDSRPPYDWHVLLGGAYSDQVCGISSPWLKLCDFCGLQFYIIRASAYDIVLNMDPESTLHIDKWMGTESGLNCYRPKKIFALQRSGYSDNVKRKINYDNALNKRDLL